MSGGGVQSYWFEAENLTIESLYEYEEVAAASGGKGLRLPLSTPNGAEGSASFAFNGLAGTYQIELGYFDETDGRATFGLNHNGSAVESFVAGGTGGATWAAASSHASHTFSTTLDLDAGDRIGISSTRSGGELGRIDYVSLVPVGGAGAIVPAGLAGGSVPSFGPSNAAPARFIVEAEDTALSGYYETEALSHLGQGEAGIRLTFKGEDASVSDGSSGTASFRYSGPDGTYTISARVFDEVDGEAGLTLSVNGSAVGRHTLSDYNGGTSTQARGLRDVTLSEGVSLSTGDIVTLTGAVEGHEYARIDALMFDPAGLTGQSLAPTPAPVQAVQAPAPQAPAPSNNGFPAHWEKLDNGINVDRYSMSQLGPDELKYLADLGVENIRLMMDPDQYLTTGQAMNPSSNAYVLEFAGFMQKIIDAGMAVVITPIGVGHRPDYVNAPNNQWSINQYDAWWGEFAAYVNGRFSPEDVFLETQGEPFMNDHRDWQRIESQFVETIREAAPEFTIVSSSNGFADGVWSHIRALTVTEPYDDPNIVYNVHYYNPEEFTHQEYVWNNVFADVRDVSYPGGDYNAGKIRNQLKRLDDWEKEHGTFVTVNEFGAIIFAEEDDRAAYYRDVRNALEEFDLGWSAFELDKAFGLAAVPADEGLVLENWAIDALGWGA
ncbi:MAG: cellulase family glycosylhydrolase [Pseudomonadota bacterium]